MGKLIANYKEVQRNTRINIFQESENPASLHACLSRNIEKNPSIHFTVVLFLGIDFTPVFDSTPSLEYDKKVNFKAKFTWS